MNTTDGIQCETCQISSGFTSTDRRAIIVMVVLVSLALISCYTGVLWYSIRKRFVRKQDDELTIVQKNEAFQHNDDDQFEEYVNPIPEDRRKTIEPNQHVQFSTENELIPV